VKPVGKLNPEIQYTSGYFLNAQLENYSTLLIKSSIQDDKGFML